jgi:hypothetical protein
MQDQKVIGYCSWAMDGTAASVTPGGSGDEYVVQPEDVSECYIGHGTHVVKQICPLCVLASIGGSLKQRRGCCVVGYRQVLG